MHLTYCTNVHPGEGLSDLFEHVEKYASAVRQRVAPDRAFGVGLRVSHDASLALENEAARTRLKASLQTNGLYVFTINGFPYGRFHRARVKEAVYRPDWQEVDRLTYTDRLARLLCELLPEGTIGSISTLPGASKERAKDPERIADALISHCATLVELERTRARSIRLAIEPEPCCFLETVDETVRFFEEHLFCRAAQAKLARRADLDRAATEDALRRHLTVCLDACHAAVEYEDPDGAVDALARTGISIGKVQLSAGLSIAPLDSSRRAALARFAEDVYLHQVVARRGASVRARYLDLPDALEDSASEGDDEWRVHFHVPIFVTDLGTFASTQEFLEALLARHRRAAISDHFEVETYTWEVLPPELRLPSVVDSIARELEWAQARLAP